MYSCVGVKDPEPAEAMDPMVADNASRQHRYVSGQYFFEYLVVVSLKKTKDGSSYEPQITYQFPKVSLMERKRMYIYCIYCILYIGHCIYTAGQPNKVNLRQTALTHCPPGEDKALSKINI